MGSNTEKKAMNQSTKLVQKLKQLKMIKSDNFCYRQVGRGITKWVAIEKSPILGQLFLKGTTQIILPTVHLIFRSAVFACVRT